MKADNPKGYIQDIVNPHCRGGVKNLTKFRAISIHTPYFTLHAPAILLHLLLEAECPTVYVSDKVSRLVSVRQKLRIDTKLPLFYHHVLSSLAV